MEPIKWKSVVISIGTYKMLKTLAIANHRTISGQLTHVLELYVRNGAGQHDDEKRAVNQ